MHFLFLWNLWQQLLDIHIHTLQPRMTHCFYSARPTQQSNSCSVVKALIKSLFVFSVLQQLKWVSLHILQTLSCREIVCAFDLNVWMHLQCARAGTGWDLLSQWEMQWPWQPGLCCQNNSQIWEMGRYLLAYCRFFPPYHNVMWEGREAEPCPRWTRQEGQVET